MKTKFKVKTGYLITKMHVNLTGQEHPFYFRITDIVDGEMKGSYSEDTRDVKLMELEPALRFAEELNEANPDDLFEVVEVSRVKGFNGIKDTVKDSKIKLAAIG